MQAPFTGASDASRGTGVSPMLTVFGYGRRQHGRDARATGSDNHQSHPLRVSYDTVSARVEVPVTAAQAANPLEAYQWTPQPQAEAFVIGLVEQFLKADAFSRNFRERLEKGAGVRFSDLVD